MNEILLHNSFPLIYALYIYMGVGLRLYETNVKCMTIASGNDSY